MKISKITDLTFKGNPTYITQQYSSSHKATDYGTYRRKIEIYPIEDGEVTYVGLDSYGANVVKIYYPRINKTFSYVHLDKVYVKKGEEVNNNTVIGLTGMTGNATGIHLHLGIYDNATKKYIDPEVYALEYDPNDDIIYYTVQKGDNLTKIAKKYNTSWKKIYNDNRTVIGDNPNLIFPGQVLVIK